MKVPSSAIILVIYLTYIFTSAYDMVGTTPQPVTYTWFLPWEILIFFVIPAILGYFIRKEEEE